VQILKELDKKMTGPDRSRDLHKALVTGDREEEAWLGKLPAGGSMFDRALIVHFSN
jgi:hypothetical protein